MMNLHKITLRENELFERWREGSAGFVFDGVPNPYVFESSPVRTLFILKEVNIPDLDVVFDQRLQLATEPDPWWHKMGSWCAAISAKQDITPDWKDLEYYSNDELIANDELINRLAPFAFMQLNKTGGGGSSEDQKLRDSAEKNHQRIIDQIGIYQPDVIIGCGTGDILFDLFNSLGPSSKKIQTSRGVYYSDHKLSDRKVSTLIHFSHPSARVPRNLLCYGLLDAYREVCGNRERQKQTDCVRNRAAASKNNTEE